MVDNIGGIGGAGGNVPARRLKHIGSTGNAKPADSVELSSDVMKLKGVEGVRLDKVMEVKRAIANGTFMSAEKLDKALDRALDDISSE